MPVLTEEDNSSDETTDSTEEGDETTDSTEEGDETDSATDSSDDKVANDMLANLTAGCQASIGLSMVGMTLLTAGFALLKRKENE